MPKTKLLDDDEDFGDVELKESSEYAKNYNQWRRKEEEHKYEAKHGKKLDLQSDSENESGDSSSEDDEGEGKIPEDFDRSFYKALACLKKKDPKIYKSDVKFFKQMKEDEDNKKESKKQKEKPLFLKDYESKIVVERGGKFSDSENDEEEENKKFSDPTYVQEQQEIRDSFKIACSDGDDDEENLFGIKTQTSEEVQEIKDSYAEFLKGQEQNINEEDAKELKSLRDYWKNPSLDKNEKFLRDYILNNGHMDKESAEIDFDYEQKVHDSDENLSEDEHNIDKQEEFEHKYNFRFEEPDQEFIKRYPRTLEDTLRKKDTRRAQKRAEVKARKEQEKLQKREELKQLKAMKRKEIEEKLEKLKEITGNDDLRLDIFDLDADYDPEKYDKQMSQVFNEEYYAGEEGDIKPEFPEIDDELCVESTWDDYDPTTDEIVDNDGPYQGGPHCEDADFNMDADFDRKKSLEEELIESTKKRKRRRRSKFAEMISKEKPKFDPTTHSSYREYYNQYYALDYEDMIGDLPCRFKYRQVVPNDYGLSVEEILMADDRELNKWCSLKKALEHKPDDREYLDVKRYQQKASNEGLKKKILKSLYSNQEEEENPAPLETIPQNSKSSKKRKKNKKSADQSNPEKSTATTPAITCNPEPPKKKLKNKNKKVNSNESEIPNEQQSASPIKKEVKDTQVLSATNSQEVKVSSNKKKKNASNSTENILESSAVPKIKKEKQNTVELSNSKGKNKESISNGIQKVESAVGKKKNKTKKQKNPDDNLHKIQNGGISKPNKQSFKNKNKNNDEKLSKKEKRKQLYKERNAKSKEKSKETDPITGLSDERLKAYGFNPKKFKNKLKYAKKK